MKLDDRPEIPRPEKAIMNVSRFITCLWPLFWGITAALPVCASTEGLVFFGDMAVPELNVRSSPETRGAVKLHVELWEDGVLPLSFNPDISQSQIRKVLKACSQWEAVADVHCQIGPYKGRTLEVGAATPGCWAVWGMGFHFGFVRARMNLDDGCWHDSTLIHEIGHAFGMIHEHQRPDRDEYVIIQEENLAKGFGGLQRKVNFDEQDAELVTPYDFLSIMHYSRRAFSKNGKNTIVPRPPFSKYLEVIGTVRRISKSDALTMAQMYGQKTFPGFNSPLGSKTFLIPRRSSISAGVRE